MTRGTLEDWERIGGKPKKKGEWEINEESLRENQGETNKESLRVRLDGGVKNWEGGKLVGE